MRFTLNKTYSLTVYDKDANHIYHACGLRLFKNKASVLKWAAWAALRERRTFGHVSVCDDETSQIVRYTPSGANWDNTPSKPEKFHVTKKRDYLEEEGMLLTDKKIFGDNGEHEYDVFCRDGHAIAIPSVGELLTNPQAPRLLELTYPKKDELTQEQKEECLKYRGLYNVQASMCHVGDICMSLGKLSVIKK